MWLAIQAFLKFTGLMSIFQKWRERQAARREGAASVSLAHQQERIKANDEANRARDAFRAATRNPADFAKWLRDQRRE